MNYRGLIETIRKECERRKISCYKLSRISSVPISTVYGIFHYENKAQIDTICMLLEALGLQLKVVEMSDNTDMGKDVENDEMWVEDLRELSYEKRGIIQKLVMYLKE